MPDDILPPDRVVYDQDQFSPTEVGITHQYKESYIRLTDDGDVEIVAAPGLAIILHPHNKSITFVADSIKFFTNDPDGLRWNKLAFNRHATKYVEPAFVPFDEQEIRTVYQDLDLYIATEEEADG